MVQEMVFPPAFGPASPSGPPSCIDRDGRLARAVSGLGDPDGPRHFLVTGPAGSGKSRLLAEALERLKTHAPAKASPAVAPLWEAHLFVHSLDSLAEEILAVAGLDSGQECGPKGRTPPPVERLRLALSGESPLVLVLERLDLVLEALGNKGFQGLRALLDDFPGLTILASAPATFRRMIKARHTLRRLFVHLPTMPFTEAESRRLIRSVNPGAVRVYRQLHLLCAGNPRALVLAASSLSGETGSASTRATALAWARAMDCLLPGFHGLLENAAPLQRRIMAALASRPGAMPVKEAARAVSTTHQSTSKQLGELKARGMVLARGHGRESHYEPTDPFFRPSLALARGDSSPLDQARFAAVFAAGLGRRELVPDLLLPIRKPARLALPSRLQLPEKRAVGDRTDPAVGDFLNLYHGGRLAEALRTAQTLASQRGEAVDYLLQGAALFRLDRKPEALIYFTKACELDPDSQRARFNLGLALTASAREKEALEAFALAASPDQGEDSRQARLMEGHLLRHLGRGLEALGAFEKALAHDAGKAEDLQKQAGSESVAGMERLLSVRAARAEAWRGKAEVFAARRDWEEASRAFSTAQGLSPDDPGLHAGLGLSRLLAGEIDEGLYALTRALEMAPEDGIRRAVLALARLYAGRPEKGLDEVKELPRRGPAKGPAGLAQGLILATLERHGEAVDSLRTAVRTNTSPLAANLALAVCLAVLGEEELFRRLETGLGLLTREGAASDGRLEARPVLSRLIRALARRAGRGREVPPASRIRKTFAAHGLEDLLAPCLLEGICAALEDRQGTRLARGLSPWVDDWHSTFVPEGSNGPMAQAVRLASAAVAWKARGDRLTLFGLDPLERRVLLACPAMGETGEALGE